MKKALLLSLLMAVVTVGGFAQTGKYWSASTVNPGSIATDKAVARLAYPKVFKLFALDIEPLRQQLFSIADRPGKSTVISLPNADGGVEDYEVYEASNFEPALQARFPQIRAYSGRGITDKYAMLKLSISPQGIQTMTFRTDKDNEFIEAYSQDHKIYSVFKSQREKGKLPWVCTTEDKQMASDISHKIGQSNIINSNTGEIRTMRLAQSCNGEYANYFGAFSAADVALVLAAYNATLTRCNGCYEKDLAIHLNLIPQTTDVIYYNPATDPYTTMANWNTQLMNTLKTVIGDPNFDIGHMFGASGGGGNAGCIGCVCDNGSTTSTYKGAGITSPADGIPQGDNFDIDYVVHEVGHQMGANHTFTHSNESTGRQKEVGAGITIMGYAGITSWDPAPHSIDIYHETSIEQIQANMTTRTCPIVTNMTVNHAPVVAPVSNYTIPISTPFALTGSATDPENDPLTYCWEQNDVHGGQTGNNSVAYAAKPVGPNYISFSPSASPTRYFPRLATILAGLLITPTLGGDAICNVEALSNVSRTLNFRLTVRDNVPYVAGVKTGQTQYTDMTVTVTNSSGPFKVTAPNTNVTYPGGSTQTITWDVANTTSAPVSCANVKISLSTDGGQTFPTVLAASTPNDGSEVVTIPSVVTSTARIKIESVGNIFFDIDDANFNIIAANPTFDFVTPSNATVSCGTASGAITLATTSVLGFSTPITLTASGNPGGTTVSYSVNPVTPGNSTIVTLNGMATLAPGSYPVTITGTAGAEVKNVVLTYVVNPGTGPSITGQPGSPSVCAGGNTSFSISSAAATGFQWQVSTTGAGGPWNNISNGGVYSGATTATLSITGATAGMNNYQYRCVASVLCGSTNSNAGILTVNAAPAVTGNPINSTICAGNNTSFTVIASGAGITYQWQESTNGGGSWNNISNGGIYGGATTSTLTLTGVTIGMNNYQYRCVVSGSCAPSANSAAATLTVGTALSITSQPGNVVLCAGTNTTFSVAISGTVISYQWQESTTGVGGPWNNISNGGVYSGATTGTLTITGALAGMNGYAYRCVVTGACPAINSNAATLTVNTAPSITSQAANSTVCATQNTTYTIAATGTAISYQWQLSTAGCAGPWNNIVNGAPYSGATTASLTITGAPASMNGYAYRCVVNGTCSPAATSNCVTLTVNTPVGITTQPLSSTVCAGTNTSFSVVASGTTPTYQWQESTNGGGSWNNITNGGIYGGATTATLNLTGVTAGMNSYQYRCIVNGTAPCGSLNSNAATLTVNTAPAITANPVTGTILCAGQNTSYSVTANGTALTYQWQLSTDGGTSWNNITNGGVYGGATTNTLSITGATAAMNSYRYRCVISGTCSPSATSNSTTLTVYTPVSVTSPVSSPSGNTICATGTISFSVTGAGTSPTYQWQESTNGGGTWNNIANGGVYSNAGTNTLTLTGVTPSMNNNQYRCVVTGLAPCGSLNSTAATLTVSPRPAVTLTAAPFTKLLPGLTTTITATVTPSTGYTNAWTWNGAPLPGVSNSYVVDVNGLGVYTVVSTIGTCISEPASITIGDSASSRLFVYPSPNDGRFTVSYYSPGASASNKTNQRLAIFGPDGKRVYNVEYPVTQPYQLLKVDLRNTGAGIYNIILFEANGNAIKTGRAVVR
ncbi:MAG: zinc-dependent metalloprotease family protein [Ferruginibacter sp.]